MLNAFACSSASRGFSRTNSSCGRPAFAGPVIRLKDPRRKPREALGPPSFIRGVWPSKGLPGLHADSLDVEELAASVSPCRGRTVTFPVAFVPALLDNAR